MINRLRLLKPRQENCFAASKSLRSNQDNRLEFEDLEDRRLLATVAFTGGNLQITLDANDSQLEIGTDNQFVTLDGTNDLDLIVAGDQQVAVSEVSSIQIQGVSAIHNVAQTVVLAGVFDQASTDSLDTLLVTGLNEFVLDGVLEIDGSMTIGLANDPVGVVPLVRSTGNANLTVTGSTAIHAGQGSIDLLTSDAIDLQGSVSLISLQPGGQVRLTNEGPLELQNVLVTGNVHLVGPQVTDADNANIRIQGVAYLHLDEILLGETAADTFETGGLNFKSTGSVSIDQDTTIVLAGISYADSASLSTPGSILDGVHANTNITNLLSLTGSHIALGERGVDQFNTGQLSFLSEGHVSISEDSSVELYGKNAAATADLLAEGDITNHATAILDVLHHFGVQASGDITIGTTETDRFNTGTVFFGSLEGTVTLHEDSDMNVLETKNFARNLNLSAIGNLTDHTTTRITVLETASFSATGVIMIGDSAEDLFKAGKLNFTAGDLAQIYQDDGILLTGINTARRVDLRANGSLLDDAEAITTIDAAAILEANSIVLGDADPEKFSSGWLWFNAPGFVSVSSSEWIWLSQNVSAHDTYLVSELGIRDTIGADTAVNRNTSLLAPFISMGRAGAFNTEMLNFNSGGNVRIIEDDGLMLYGVNHANSARISTEGVLNNAEGSIVNAVHLLDFEAHSIELGMKNFDHMASQTLSFNATDRAMIEFDSDILMVYSSRAKSFNLSSTGDIRDYIEAQVHASEFSVVSGIDIVLGDADEDCFDVSDENLDIFASGLQEVTFDLCP